MASRRPLSLLLYIILNLLIITGMVGSVYQTASAYGSHVVYLPSISRSTSGQGSSSTDVLIASSTTWKYLDNGSNQENAWRSPAYDDSQWKSGPAELGYGEGDEHTVISFGENSSQKYITTYFRGYFSINPTAAIESMDMKLNRDDGAVVYINGAEVYRTNVPDGEIGYQTNATKAAEGIVETRIDASSLVEGTNVIAVEVHQATARSSDISFSMELIGNIVSPVVQPTETPTVLPTAQPTQLPQPPSEGTAWYVTPNGSSTGQGSMDSPWSFETALAHPSSVQPGDTIWVRGGTYGSGGDAAFTSELQGASGKYITVRAYPGEKVIIDGGIAINEPYSIFWGFEVLNTNADRSSAESGSHPDDVARSDGFGVYASNTKLINNIVHDTNGIGAWEAAVEVELYGNIVYNSGWAGPDRGHGHGLYMQNENGIKSIVDNIIFNNYSNYNVHIYTERAHIQGFYMEGNVSLNGKLLAGGLQPASSISLNQNNFYNSYVQLGYDSELINHDLTLTNNTFASSGQSLLEIKLWDGVTATGNRFLTPDGKAVTYMTPPGGSNYQWNNNDYRVGDGSPFAIDGSSIPWPTWRSTTGYDGSSSLQTAQPGGVEVIVRPNQYEPKRANISVYNWDHQNTVTVDLSETGLQPGDAYVLHNGENWTETITGVYDGNAISVPMTGWTIAKPIGASAELAPATFPLFGVFVLTTQ